MPDLKDELSCLVAQLDPSRASVIDELTKVRSDLSSRSESRASPMRLTNLRIASPCKERWADMVGDDRVRVCNGCERPVFDLSQMTRAEAEAVLATRGVTPCVRFYRRADGTVMTADCGPGARRKVRVAAIAAGTVLLGASPVMADPAGVSPPVEAHGAFDGAIQGVVKDAVTDEPLIGVTIVVTGPTVQTALSDETGSYRVSSLTPGNYLVTFYYNDTIVERSNITVGVGKTTPVFIQLQTDAEIPAVVIDASPTMGLPPSTQDFDVYQGEQEMGVIIDPAPAHRPVIEWSTWARIGVGTESRSHDLLARSTTQPPPRAERDATLEAALGADLTLPIALRGALRVGAWTEVRTSSGPVVGAELQLQAVPHRLRMFQYSGEGLVSIRAGGNEHVVTGAIAYGYLAPWNLRGTWDGASRYLIGVRVVGSVTRSVDDPREWTATAGLELEPVGAVRYVRAWVRGE
jgi:hypothetical protein